MEKTYERYSLRIYGVTVRFRWVGTRPENQGTSRTGGLRGKDRYVLIGTNVGKYTMQGTNDVIFRIILVFFLAVLNTFSGYLNGHAYPDIIKERRSCGC